MGLIELEVVNVATTRFFDICAGLVEGEWEEIQGNHQIGRLVDRFIGSALEAQRAMEEQLCPLQHTHVPYFDGCSKRANGADACGEENAPVPPLGKIGRHERQIIGIIKDE